MWEKSPKTVPPRCLFLPGSAPPLSAHKAFPIAEHTAPLCLPSSRASAPSCSVPLLAPTASPAWVLGRALLFLVMEVFSGTHAVPVKQQGWDQWCCRTWDQSNGLCSLSSAWLCDFLAVPKGGKEKREINMCLLSHKWKSLPMGHFAPPFLTLGFLQGGHLQRAPPKAWGLMTPNFPSCSVRGLGGM